MNIPLGILVYYILFGITSYGLDQTDVTYVIVSQKENYHKEKAIKLKNDILSQSSGKAVVHLTHEFSHLGDWTIFPLISRLSARKNNSSWFFFCTEDTQININKFTKFISKYNSSIEWFIGRGLSDHEPTIIHHFASHENFKYPLFSSGFALSQALLERLNADLSSQIATRTADFSIDASYEFALFVWNEGKGTGLTHSPLFCVEQSSECVTSVSDIVGCDEPVPAEDILFAVKTCQKYHKNRVPIVKMTWGSRATHIFYFSDVGDDKIPTVVLETPNSSQGHCKKTAEIIKRAKDIMEDLPSVRWVVIADDDTILSVRRIREMLSCYKDEEALVIGERYGYNLHSSNGYNYVTGGAGIILSKETVWKLGNPKNCPCVSATTPDDMFLMGVCLNKLNITLVHCPLLHQARPEDYSPDYLSVGRPASFHKHWMVDPVKVYNRWFQNEELDPLEINRNNLHTEL